MKTYFVSFYEITLVANAENIEDLINVLQTSDSNFVIEDNLLKYNFEDIIRDVSIEEIPKYKGVISCFISN